MSMGREYCTACANPLEDGQIGLCDACIDERERDNTPGTVRGEHGMTCPHCQHDDQLDVVYSAWTRLVPDGTDDELVDDHDLEWDEQSPCRCGACGWTGTVKDARWAAGQPAHLIPGARVLSLRGETGHGDDGNEHETSPHAWGHVSYIVLGQEHCYSVVFPEHHHVSALLSAAELADASAYRVEPQ